jgi:hypothetical protein
VISAKLAFALRTLAENGKLTGTRTRRVSARVDPGLVEAARIKTGLNNDSELINAALAVIAAPDDFGPWFAAQAGRLPNGGRMATVSIPWRAHGGVFTGTLLTYLANV